MSSAEAAEADSQNSHAFPVTSFHHHHHASTMVDILSQFLSKKKANDLPESEFLMSGPAAITFRNKLTNHQNPSEPLLWEAACLRSEFSAIDCVGGLIHVRSLVFRRTCIGVRHACVCVRDCKDCHHQPAIGVFNLL